MATDPQKYKTSDTITIPRRIDYVLPLQKREKPRDPFQLIKEGYRVYEPYKDKRGRLYIKMVPRFEYVVKVTYPRFRYTMDASEAERLKRFEDTIDKMWLPKEIPFTIMLRQNNMTSKEGRSNKVLYPNIMKGML